MAEICKHYYPCRQTVGVPYCKVAQITVVPREDKDGGADDFSIVGVWPRERKS